MFKLVIQDDEGKTTVVPLIRDEITIGRKEGNTIRLTERNVSRRHARIVRNNGEVQIEDLGSYNGIRVNNARIAERVSLRISDQVQIGDYKLYLKAEGVEQVDDARTMPIERIDAPPTEQMPAVAPSSPTVPIPAQTLAAAAATPPNRALGTADTDPQGRPVATAAQVAALTAPVNYGKLVVISSNYAGKEFDLTRPQMIVGRTDENDLVINHRSISRNHAKITRDPETGRYTISDLQSSNGVRVNGQDYGKVELRRGDVIDLGHVRLRFVEPGEDWLFARDAVIADVPEAGGKRGMFIAIALGVLVLAGVGVFFVLNKSGKEEGPKKTDVAVNPGSDVASGSVGVGPQPDHTTNPTVESIDAPQPAVAVTNGGNDEASRIAIRCKDYRTQKKWQDLDNCANDLAKFDGNTAKALKDTAKSETTASNALDDLRKAVRQKDLAQAKKAYDSIGEDSIYRKDATESYGGLEGQIVDQYKASATALKKQHKCGEFDRLAQRAQNEGSPKAAEAVRNIGSTCEEKVASTTIEHKNPTTTGTGSGSSGSATQTPPPAACDADALETKGLNDEAMGQHAAALQAFENEIACRQSPRAIQLAFMASCNSNNPSKAKKYYKKMPPDAQARFAVMCVRRGISVDQLSAP